MTRDPEEDPGLRKVGWGGIEYTNFQLDALLFTYLCTNMIEFFFTSAFQMQIAWPDGTHFGLCKIVGEMCENTYIKSILSEYIPLLMQTILRLFLTQR